MLHTRHILLLLVASVTTHNAQVLDCFGFFGDDGDDGGQTDTGDDGMDDQMDDGTIDLPCNYSVEGIVDAPDFVWFNDGADIEAGEFEIHYTDGCMRGSTVETFCWTVHQGSEDRGYYLVDDDSDITKFNKVKLPGPMGSINSDPGCSDNFAGCVAIGLALDPIDYNHTADGRLGVYLYDRDLESGDTFYDDNVAGTPNPTFTLFRKECL